MFKFTPLRATPKKNQSFTLVLFFCPPVSRTLEHYASQGFGWFPPFKANTFALIFLFWKISRSSYGLLKKNQSFTLVLFFLSSGESNPMFPRRSRFWSVPSLTSHFVWLVCCYSQHQSVILRATAKKYKPLYINDL